jgi:hypothetical protein
MTRTTERKTMTTAETITRSQLETLKAEAGAAGDPGTVALCHVALGQEYDGDCGDIDPSEYSADEAKSACADVISYAEAIED